MALEEIRSERIKKVLKLKESGIDPYPGEANRKFLIAEIIKKFPVFTKSKKEITVLGRVIARREHGGSMFFDVKDASGKMQLYFKEDILGKKSYDILQETIDIGDFIEVKGKPFLTKRGEKTILVGSWKMLAKSLRPLPEKWHGLQDIEERFRKRYLDLLMNEEVCGRFLMRTKIISALREILDKDNFKEVETPMLHVLPGGALARPFKTHHNALDIDLYLRIAPELYLKRLLVGGMERVYEIGRNFRNEGIDATHNPEFTMLECYAAYWDEENMIGFVEDLFTGLLKILKKKAEIDFDGKKIKIKPPFYRISFKDVLKRYALIVDYDKETRDSLATRAKQFGVEVSGYEEKGKIADEIYKKICRPHFINPTFVTGHPLDISPLAKKTLKNQFETRRFQLIVAGLEMANGFSELNDPLDQRVRFEAQEKEGARGEEEAHRLDEDFLEALEYGMPPAAGLGIGIDRLVMLLTDTKNIRETVLFPIMRPK